jgi:hypothetical protein
MVSGEREEGSRQWLLYIGVHQGYAVSKGHHTDVGSFVNAPLGGILLTLRLSYSFVYRHRA